MKLRNYIKLAMTNISRRKKSVRGNILLISLALIILIITSTLGSSMNIYIDNFLLEGLDHRNLLIFGSKDESKQLEKKIGDIVKEDNNMVEFYQELFGVTVETDNMDELIDKELIKLDESYGYVNLNAGNLEHKSYIIKGSYFNSDDSNVGIIPKKFYPDLSFKIDFSKENIDFINGESLIGKTINVKYYSYDITGDKLEKIKTFDYSFKVVGVYEIEKNLNYPHEVFIPRSDLKEIIEKIEANDIGAAEDSGINYSVILNSYDYVDKAMDKFNKVGLDVSKIAEIGSIVDVSKYIFLVGEILGIIIICISLINIILTMFKSIKERTGEIGLLKAIGYSNKNIVTIIGMEGMTIGVLSFLFSSVVSLGVLRILDFIISSKGSIYMQRFSLEVSYKYIGILGILSIVLPTLASIHGMIYSLKVKPKEAISKGRGLN